MRGKSPSEAVTTYIETLQRALSCVTADVVRASGIPQSGASAAIFLARGEQVRLDGGRIPLALRVLQQFTVEEDTLRLRRERWRITIRQYMYSIEEPDSERAIVAFHWHPHIEGKPFPHLHLHAASGIRPELAALHIPTERVALEDVLRLLLEELEVQPRRQNWHQVLTATRSAFVAARRWPWSGMPSSAPRANASDGERLAVAYGMVDLDRAAALACDDLRGFIAHADDWPMTRRQELRGFFVSWIARFLPAVLKEGASRELFEWLGAREREPDSGRRAFRTIMAIPILPAAAALRDDYRLWQLRDCIDLGQSALRDLAHEGLALVADLLSVEDDVFVERLTYNVVTGQPFLETNVALLLAAQGASAQKRQVLQSWRSRYRDGTPDATTLDRALGEGRLPNPFLPFMLELQQYVSVRFAVGAGQPATIEPAKADDRTTSVADPDVDEVLDRSALMLWAALRAHPLMGPSVNLR